MEYRIVIAGLALLAMVLLFAFQYRLMDRLGRREDQAVHHLDGK